MLGATDVGLMLLITMNKSLENPHGCGLRCCTAAVHPTGHRTQVIFASYMNGFGCQILSSSSRALDYHIHRRPRSSPTRRLVHTQSLLGSCMRKQYSKQPNTNTVHNDRRDSTDIREEKNRRSGRFRLS